MALLQNHQIKLLSEEASTSLKASERVGHAPASNAAASTSKSDPFEKLKEHSHSEDASDPAKQGVRHEIECATLNQVLFLGPI